MPKIICIDIDGTLVKYTEWSGPNNFGEVLPDAAEATQKLHANGWYIIIYTTRADNEATGKFLHDNGFYFDSINGNPFQPENAEGGKPFADVYVDDRALCFKGDWKQTLKDIENFKPWEKMNGDTAKKDFAKEVLLTDFQQALYLHRHYDEMNSKLTNFAFAQVLVSVGACWTLLYAMVQNPQISILQAYSVWAVFTILLLSAAFLLVSSLLICKNRIYFVKICRYINELRRFAIDNNDVEFKNTSKMWANPSFPRAFDKSSTQLICFYLISGCYALESIASGIAFYHAASFCCKELISFLIPIGMLVLGVVLVFYTFEAKQK